MEALKCPGCGAPLAEPAAPGEYATCSFCGARSRTTTITTEAVVTGHPSIVIRSGGPVHIGGDVVAGDVVADDLADTPINHSSPADPAVGAESGGALSWLNDLTRNRAPHSAPPPQTAGARLLRAWRRLARRLRALFRKRPMLPTALTWEAPAALAAVTGDDPPAGGISIQGGSITIAGDLVGRDKVVNRRR